MPETRAIIFDFDGLIVDTETAVYDSWVAVYAEQGEALELETYKNCVGADFGRFDPQSELERRTGGSFDWDTINAERSREITRQLETKDARPGVRDFIGAASDLGLPLAVASSSSREWVAGWLERLDLARFFGVLRNRDDVARVKPHPDLFLGAAEGLGAAPADTLVLEDSENGLKAATAAGMRCAIVTNPVTAGGDFAGALLEAPCFTDERIGALI